MRKVVLFLITSCALQGHNIGIIHYRIGKTDGVSLEIEKRKTILENMGHTVKLISGPIQKRADFIVDELEFERPELVQIKENSFAYFGRQDLSDQELLKKIDTISKTIENKFLTYYKQEQFDVLLIHNIFSLGLHLPAASAFYRIAQNLNIPIIATHHDFYWERKKFCNPSRAAIDRYCKRYIPPKLPNITHVCINSLAQADLREKRTIESLVFPDVFDFEQPLWTVDEYNQDFLDAINVKPNDLIVLQATRIVPRKGIELAIQFVKELTHQKGKLIGKRLFNGKKFTQDSAIVLVLAGYAEDFARPYLKTLKQKIAAAGIEVRFVDTIIGAQRSLTPKKVYSLWDAYVFADLVTYPSLWEGWGNQFIEAIFAKKPIVLFEYPVFESDIKDEGYFVLSLGKKLNGTSNHDLVTVGNKTIERAVEHALETLTSPTTNELLERNFSIGKQYHSYDRLQNFLHKLFSTPLHSG